MKLQGICDTTGLAQFELTEAVTDRFKGRAIWVYPIPSPRRGYDRYRLPNCECELVYTISVEHLPPDMREIADKQIAAGLSEIITCACAGRLIE